MTSKQHWSPGSDVSVQGVERSESGGWIVSGSLTPNGICPECGLHSRRRHGWWLRRLQDYPAHGDEVTVDLAVCRWRCQVHACPRRTFSDQIAAIARPFARRTSRVAQIVSHLERRAVIDILEDRDVGTCTNWLKRHPEVDVISRDRCGLYAQAAGQGAPQAKQVADRFHIVQNLRQAIEEQMNLHGRATGRALLSDADNISAAGSLLKSRLAHRTSREEIFNTIHALRNQGLTCSEIGRRTGFPRRSIAKWVQFETPPDRRRAALKPTSPWYFEEFLRQSWKEGIRTGSALSV